MTLPRLQHSLGNRYNPTSQTISCIANNCIKCLEITKNTPHVLLKHIILHRIRKTFYQWKTINFILKDVFKLSTNIYYKNGLQYYLFRCISDKPNLYHSRVLLSMKLHLNRGYLATKLNIVFLRHLFGYFKLIIWICLTYPYLKQYMTSPSGSIKLPKTICTVF